jgi:hypothetical protein
MRVIIIVLYRSNSMVAVINAISRDEMRRDAELYIDVNFSPAYPDPPRLPPIFYGFFIS